MRNSRTRSGLDTEILTSAGKTLGIEDMPGLADYVMERVARHGRRRAAELLKWQKRLKSWAFQITCTAR